MTTAGTFEHIQYIAELDVFEAMVKLLDCNDNQVLICLLDAYQHMLDGAANHCNLDPYTTAIEESGALDKLEELQSHENHVSS